MDHLWLNNDGWILIFYTGKQELSPAVENAKFNSNIKLFKSRPDFDVSTPHPNVAEDPILFSFNS